MGMLKCGCVISDSRNTPAVRKGFEVSGSIKSRCAKHEAEYNNLKEAPLMNKNKLADELTDTFIEYQWRLENPMPNPNQTAASIKMYQNDYVFRAKVQNWVSGVMHVVEKHI